VTPRRWTSGGIAAAHRYAVLHLHLRFVEVRCQSEGDVRVITRRLWLRKTCRALLDALSVVRRARGHRVRNDGGMCARVAVRTTTWAVRLSDLRSEGKATIGERSNEKMMMELPGPKMGDDEEIRNIMAVPGLFPRSRLGDLS